MSFVGQSRQFWPRRTRPFMSAMPPIAPKMVRRSETTRRAIGGSRAAKAARQSALIPAALMILPHFCVSRFQNAARSCGEPDLCLAPNLARLASISGDCRHAINQLIEPADDGLGSTGWSSDAGPEGALQFRESTLGRGRYTRQQIVATVIGHGKRCAT